MKDKMKKVIRRKERNKHVNKSDDIFTKES
jgi:hypothetical protein